MMSPEDRHHLDRETVEQLLDGASASPGAERLESLLRAAAAPARPGDLAGEDAALLAFRAAAGRRRFSWRRLLTIKVLASVAAVTVGGLAFASTTGIIPTPFKMDPQQTPPVVPGNTNQAPATSAGPESPPASAAASPTASPAGVPNASIHGLCNAFLAKPAHERSKALESPAFQDLVQAAGGPEHVESFCTEAGPANPGKSHPARPSRGPEPPGR